MKLCLPTGVYGDLLTHLDAGGNDNQVEQVAFLLTEPHEDGVATLRVKWMYPVPLEGFEIQTDSHVSLTDEVRAYAPAALSTARLDSWAPGRTVTRPPLEVRVPHRVVRSPVVALLVAVPDRAHRSSRRGPCRLPQTESRDTLGTRSRSVSPDLALESEATTGIEPVYTALQAAA